MSYIFIYFYFLEKICDLIDSFIIKIEKIINSVNFVYNI